MSTDHIDLLPTHLDVAARIAAEWRPVGTRFVSPVLWGESAGTRVGTIVRADGEVELAARGVSADGRVGVWVPLRETFREDDAHIQIADLGGTWEGAQLRLGSDVEDIAWELLTPVYEPRASTPAPPSASLPASVVALGVVSREAWGARATTCTSTEDDWYRMAIHHTAGGQTYGGTVEGQMRVLQSYAMDSGEYCDIPYQFMVGYDGSLYEARELRFYAGATGGNNDGNIAVCFIGCYHPSDCPNGAGDAVTAEMMDGGQLLVQTLVAEYGIPSDDDSIRGHRDWPDNATACPGEYVHERLDELRAPLGPRYGGSFAGQSFPTLSDGAIRLGLGEELSGWIDLTNTATETWSPGSTNLGTVPRDVASPLAGADWLSSTRPATVSASVPPGGTGRFAFTLRGNELGDTTQYFGLVQEWVTWFADDGGPAENQLAVHVIVTDDPVDSGTDGETGDDAPPDGLANGLPGTLTEAPSGCGCGVGGGAAGWIGVAVGLLGVRRRVGARSSGHEVPSLLPPGEGGA